MSNIISFEERNKRRGGIHMMEIGQAKKKKIEKKVYEILTQKSLADKKYIDIVECVRQDDFLVQSADLGMQVTGCLAVNDENTVDDRGYHKLIVVNEKYDNPDNEKDVVLKKSRFITAHEYGHYILHKPQARPIYAHRDTIHRKEPKELEADYFARSILMPAKSFLSINNALDKLQDELGMPNENFYKFKLHYLSEHFKVTKNKVEKRLGDIELLKSIVD